MKAIEYFSWFVILALAVGFAFLHKKTLDLEREIEHLRGSAQTGAHPTAEVDSPNEVPELYETEAFPNLKQELYRLGTAVQDLEKNQGVLVEKHNGLLNVIQSMNWSFEDQLQVSDPDYRSAIGGGDLASVSIKVMPRVWGVKSLY